MLKNNFKNIKLNKEICEFIGSYIGDGYLAHYEKHQYLIGISGDKKLDEDYLKNYLTPLIKRNFPSTEPRLYYRNDENTLMLRVNSKKLYDFFIKFGFDSGKKSRNIKIPKDILKNKDFMNATVRGIFDTDDCIFLDKRANYKKPYPRITLQLSSQELINQLENYLSRNFKLYVNQSNRNGYRNYIEIYGHTQLEMFLKQIGFSNKRHLNKINASVA